MRTKLPLLLLLPALSWLWTGLLSAADYRVSDLRCEYATNALGVDVPSPRLFWKLESTIRGAHQVAYEVLAASSARALAANRGDLWDSGRVESDETTQIPYAGRPLQSSQQVFWKVRVFWEVGKISSWSEPASWTMGILSNADWQAKWIAARTNSQSLLLRREFMVKTGLRRAVAHVCGLGQYELYLNGHKAGDDVLAPGWTKYDKTCLYDTRELTGLLRPGENAIGILLGNGMYNTAASEGRYTKFHHSYGPLKAILQLRLEYADGTVEIIGTDGRWRTSPGPLTFTSIYGGEDYDARLEPRGWNEPGFAGAGWTPAQVVDGPGGALRGLTCAAPPIRTFEELKPVSTNSVDDGVTVYDLGQNASIIPRLSVSGPAGSRIRIIPAELLHTNGTVDRGSVGGGKCYWQYTLAGHRRETWFPKFFYQGCRYLQVECVASNAGGELPVVQSIAGVVVQSASPPVGQFECSNPLLNRIRKLVRWAQRSNMMSVMTDCPHRERLGWLEEDHLNGPALRYEFDLARLFTKVENDMADSQLTNGLVPDIAPEYMVFPGGFRDSPEWGSSCVLVPWQQYEFDGDLDLLRRHYDVMQKYVAYLGSKSTNDIVNHGLGDWYDLGPRAPGVAQLTPIALTATAFYYYDTLVLARTADLLGQTNDAEHYADQANRIAIAFNGKFFDADKTQYATGSQCADSIPLVMGLAAESNRVALAEAIAADVRQRGNALTAGDVGYRYLLRALAESGQSQVIFDMISQSNKPGYAYQLAQGATSLTEAWDAGRKSSQNHFMLGQITEWFYRDLAGIADDPSGPGFKKIIIRPQPVGDVTWVKASYDSIHGRIACNWEKLDGEFTLQVTIPPSTTATVYVPARSPENVREAGVQAERSRGVRFLRQTGNSAVYEIQSGQYEFTSRP
jgi:hypothetical protein